MKDSLPNMDEVEQRYDNLFDEWIEEKKDEVVRQVKEAMSTIEENGAWHADEEPWPGNKHLQHWISTQHDGLAAAVRKEDALFIANAPEWLRLLIEEREQHIAENEQLIVRIMQHRKALGFVISMDVPEDPEIINKRAVEQDKEIQRYKSGLRDSFMERDEIIKILYESLEWYAKQDFKPEIAQLALDRINQS